MSADTIRKLDKNLRSTLLTVIVGEGGLYSWLKTFQKVSKLFFKFLKIGGGGYNKLNWLVKNFGKIER